MINFLFFFLVSNVIFLLYFKKISKIYGVYDIPNKRKIHKDDTPLLGGLYFFINLSLLFGYFGVRYFDVSSEISIDTNTLIVFNFLFFTLIFVLGFFDDKIDLNPNIKLCILFAIIYIFLNFNSSFVINFLNFSFTDRVINLGKYNILFTTICFLLFINACNMFDGINLQSGIYFLSICIFFIFFITQSYLLLSILISLIFFLILNFRGRIFMGDSGIYLYSFSLSLIFINLYNEQFINYADTVFIMMMVPGIDMFRLFLFRILNKKNPFRPDNNHFHHLLLNKFSYKKTILLISIIILIPLFLLFFNFSNIIILLIYLIVYFLFVLNLKNKNVF